MLVFVDFLDVCNNVIHKYFNTFTFHIPNISFKIRCNICKPFLKFITIKSNQKLFYCILTLFCAYPHQLSQYCKRLPLNRYMSLIARPVLLIRSFMLANSYSSFSTISLRSIKLLTNLNSSIGFLIAHIAFFQ